VVKSLERARTFPKSIKKTDFINVTQIAALDESTVTLSLTQPDTTLIVSLGGASGAIINPVAVDSGADLTSEVFGTTPYRLVSFDPGQTIVAERDDEAAVDYWDGSSFRTKRIELSLVGDASAALNGLQTDEFDASWVQIPLSQTESLPDDLTFTLLPHNGLRGLFLNDNVAPLDDPNVRRAIGMAIDREAIAGLVDRFTYANQLVPEGNAGYIEGYAPYEFDPEQAKALLAQAGHPSFDLQISVYATNADEMRMATVVQSQLGDVGINVSINPLAIAELSQSFGAQQLPAAFLPLGPAVEPTVGLDSVLFSTWKVGGSGSDELKGLMTEVRSQELGSAEWASGMEIFQKTVLDQSRIVPVAFGSNLWVHDKSIVGIDGWWNSIFPRWWGVLK
jgi:ABC-type transport system substrate-binding protein